MSLRVAVTMCLAARSPMQLWWDTPAFTFYNDAFVPWIGSQHPDALGRRAMDIYGARWPARQSAIQRLYVENRAIDVDGLSLMPIFDGTTIAGVVSTFAEDRVGSDLLWAVDEAVRGPLHELARHAPVDEPVRRLMRGVDDLLDITRLARGKLMLDRESVDLQTLVLALVAGATPRAAARHISLVCHRSANRFLVVADRKRLSRALTQLLFHAIDSTAGDSVRVAIERADDMIRLRMTHAGSEMPMVGRLPAQRMIELHDGAVIDQRLGTLRELVVEMPAAEKRSMNEHLRAARILLVEDDDTSASTMQMSLEHLGYVVAIAHDGAVALELARVFQPDAAVIDLRLPVIDGWEVARRLQQKHAGLPIVAMTGMEGDEYRERSARAGFVEHFFKPVDLASLHRCLTAIPSLTRFVAR